jgi:hypothetical protein
MANTKVTQHVIANNAITADQLAAGAVTDAKLHSTLDLSGKTLTLPATAIPSASTATTQAASDNSTKIATTAYVETAISNLVDSAPAALDTLNEIAAALGDDANYASTTTAAIAAKLPLAGGTLTGDLVLSGAPTSGLHPATKTYTDTADALKLNLTGGTLTGDLILNTTTALKIPAGTTGQRPSASTGQIRWNTTDGALEVYNGTAWTAVGTGSSNKVLDTFTGDGSTTTFTLSITPANEDAIMVFIDGAYQEKGDYVLTNNSLALGTAPLSGEKIAVHTTTASVHDGTTALNQAFTGDGSTTDFTLSQDPKSENNTQIYINGVYQQKTDYTVTGTTLAFDTAPDTGDIIEVNMFTVATLGNTDTVNEGVSNLYHTTARARSAISVSGNALSYNSSTGVITSAYEESPTFTGTVTTPTLITGAYGGSGSAGDGFRLNSTDLYGQIDASDKVRLTVNGDSFLNGGNVGIGTTSPSSTLDVRSSTALGSVVRKNFGGTANTSSRVALTVWGEDFDDATATDSTNIGPMIGFGTRLDSAAPNTGDIRAGIAYSYNGDLTFHAKAAVSVADGSNERMRIDGVSGNVGIGTTAPSSLLTVAGTSDLAWSAATSKLQISRSGAVARLQNYESGSASTNLALQWEGGNVGIGTDSPAVKLHVKTTADGTLQRFSRSGICDWDVSIGNTPIISGGSSGDLEIIPTNGNMGFAVGRAGQTGINMRVRDGVMTLGSGIKFNSDTAASNMLDDYEEGTWTVTDQSGAGMSLTVYVAEYTKIGNKVFFEIGMVFPTTSSTAEIRLSLPFTAKSTSDNTGGATLVGTNSGRNDLWLVNRNNAWFGAGTNLNIGVTNASYSAKQLKLQGAYTAA